MAVIGAAAALGMGCGGAPDLLVEPSSDTVTSESGTAVEVSIRLARKPPRSVSVSAVSSDRSEGIASAPISFDRTNWDEPQTMTVTGVDDDVVDGDVSYRVTFEASAVGQSSRKHHAKHTEQEVLDFINRDDDVVVFQSLGDLPGGESASYVTDISAAGDVVVGYSSGTAGEEAVRWTSAMGLLGLGGAPSRANSVSPDGTLVVGPATGDPANEGALWREGEAMQFLRGTPDTPPMLIVREPGVVLDNRVVFGGCVQAGGLNYPVGCRLDAPGQITLLNDLTTIYVADELGNYGGVRFGSSRYEPGVQVAVLNGEELPFPSGGGCIRPQVCSSEVRDFSAGAEVAVGIASIAPATDDMSLPEEPHTDSGFVYTSEAGVERLSDLAGGDETSGAYAITPNGRIIGGFGTDEEGRRAVVWVERSPLTLEQVVERQGGTIPTGWRIQEIRAMSADGQTFAGNGINPEGNPEGFRITLARAL